MNWFDGLKLALATFYTAYALANTAGPFGIFAVLRVHLPLGGLMECLVCLSPWFAVVGYVLLQIGAGAIVDILAIAGASVLVWRYTGGNYVSN